MHTGFDYDREMTVRHFIIQLKGHCKTDEEILLVLSHLTMYYASKNKKEYEHLKATYSYYKGIIDGQSDL